MVKIYYTDIHRLCEPSVLEQLCELVNEQRRSKILRCKNKEDKRRSLAAGLLLRFAMEKQGLDYEKACFSVGENGKPYLLGQDDFFFSLSHSGDMVVCAVFEEEIGADVESMHRVEKICKDASKIEGILNRIATQAEMEWFHKLPETEKTKGFLRLWPGKESFGKRNGQGISQNLRNTTVLDEAQYLFLQLEEEYYLSVCANKIKETGHLLVTIDIAKEYLK